MQIYDKIKKLCDEKGITINKMSKDLGITNSTFSDLKKGRKKTMTSGKLKMVADYLGVSADSILSEDTSAADPFPTAEVIYYNIIGTVTAGYNGQAVEEYTGESLAVPATYLHGQPTSEYFVLRVSGGSMLPLLQDGDNVLVERCSSVDSGDIAIVMYGEDASATVKKVVYSDSGVDLVPLNANYPTLHITGLDLMNCHILGKVKTVIRMIG